MDDKATSRPEPPLVMGQTFSMSAIRRLDIDRKKFPPLAPDRLALANCTMPMTDAAMRLPRAFLTVGLFSLISASLSVGAADLSSPRKLRVAITSISGSMAPPWAAHEAGIFKKYGLQ